tara:strand:+ start:3057 stop:3287 length:231 start_codon:yes stop_codon:yes gene_type:complete
MSSRIFNVLVKNGKSSLSSEVGNLISARVSKPLSQEFFTALYRRHSTVSEKPMDQQHLKTIQPQDYFKAEINKSSA